MKKLLLPLAIAALASPGTAAAARQRGIVVKVDVNAHVVVVAQKAGHVVRVHAPAKRFDRAGARFHVGQRLSFAARKLRNGSFAGSGFRVTGHASRVRVHGIVRTYDARKRSIVLSSGGTLLRMRLARTGARVPAASTPPPKAGDEVTVTASVDENDDELEATEVEPDDQQAADEDAQADDQQAQPDDQQAEQDEDQAEPGDSSDDEDGDGD
jgi:hypothetical protein